MGKTESKKNKALNKKSLLKNTKIYEEQKNEYIDGRKEIEQLNRKQECRRFYRKINVN